MNRYKIRAYLRLYLISKFDGKKAYGLSENICLWIEVDTLRKLTHKRIEINLQLHWTFSNVKTQKIDLNVQRRIYFAFFGPKVNYSKGN